MSGELTKKQVRYAAYDTFSAKHDKYDEEMLHKSDMSKKLLTQKKLVNTSNKDKTKEYRSKFKNV